MVVVRMATKVKQHENKIVDGANAENHIDVSSEDIKDSITWLRYRVVNKNGDITGVVKDAPLWAKNAYKKYAEFIKWQNEHKIILDV